MFKPVEKKSLADAVFEQLRDQIVSGEMEPGSALPAERALCEMLDVNRGAVREALKKLEQARLVSIQHGGATRVLDFRETAGTDLLADLLLTADGEVNTSVARGVMEMRSALGQDIARRCAMRSPELASELDQICEAMEAAGDDFEELAELDFAFWERIVEGSHNVAYELAFNSIRHMYDQLAGLLIPVLSVELEDCAAHRKIADAIRASDADQAEFYARDLFGRGERRIDQLAGLFDAAKEKR